MKKTVLDILYNDILDFWEETDDEIRQYFIDKGEDPDMIINRAINAVKRKEAQLKLKTGKENQNAANALIDSIFKNADAGEEEGLLNELRFAYRNKSGDIDQEDLNELKAQAQKINAIKKRLEKK